MNSAAAITFFLIINGTPIQQPMSQQACIASKEVYEYAMKQEANTLPFKHVVICLPTGDENAKLWEDYKKKGKM